MRAEGQLPFPFQMGLNVIAGDDHGLAVLLAVVWGRGVAGEELLERHRALILVGAPSAVKGGLERDEELRGDVGAGWLRVDVGPEWTVDGLPMGVSVTALSDVELDAVGAFGVFDEAQAVGLCGVHADTFAATFGGKVSSIHWPSV